MSDSEFWHDLATQFRSLDPLGTLRADWDYVIGSGVSNWRLAGGASYSVQSQFEALARRAGSAIARPQSSDLLGEWLDLLRAKARNYQNEREGFEKNADGSIAAHHLMGYIHRVCEASADYCSVLEGEAIEAEFQARTKPFVPTSPASIPNVVKPNAPETSLQTESPKPRDLWNAYSTQFAEKVVILDVCWAARQRYREWKRWLAGELKAGSKPDRAFRAILNSSKRPEEYRQEVRPAKWQ